MRIKVTYRTHKLPILYRHRFMALIKEALKTSDEGYKKYLYPAKDSNESKRTKPFTFNVSLPAQRTAQKEIIPIDEDYKVPIEDTVFYFPPESSLSLYISSADYQFIINLYNGLLSLKEFAFNPEVTLRLERVFMLNEHQITTDEVVFKTNSPVSMETKDDIPILPFRDDGEPLGEEGLKIFNQHFNAIHNRILKDIRGQELLREIEFTPLNLRKQVVKHTLKGFREKTGKPYMNLTTFQGCFKLKGAPEDLQTLYQIGVGLRTGQGFGMVEVG
ncbi:MAG: CRISPR-associated endoribonuclease Cas6 [bacterium]